MSRMKRSCPVCSSTEGGHRIHVNEFATLDGLDMSYHLARCGVCGFHFASELPAETEYLRYYRSLSKYDSQPTVSPLDRQRINAAVDFLAHAGLGKEARILDLGCGFGALLAALRDHGWSNLQGVDPAPQSAQRAFEQFGLACITQGALSDIADREELASTDLVCLMAVLEHLPELRRDLARLLAQLKPGARVLIEVPALDLFEPEAGEPFGELSLEHIQFFSLQSLCNLLAGLGAQVEHHHLLRLPSLQSGSLFVLAALEGQPSGLEPEDPSRMDAYLAGSAHRWGSAIARVPSQPFVLYGAGSHSARLLPQLERNRAGSPVAVLDGNINLHGKDFGGLTVQAPNALAQYPGMPVLISSFRSEQAIARSLRSRFSNPLVLMYADYAA